MKVASSHAVQVCGCVSLFGCVMPNTVEVGGAVVCALGHVHVHLYQRAIPSLMVDA